MTNMGFYLTSSAHIANASGHTYRYWSSYANKKRISIVEKLFDAAKSQQLSILDDFDEVKRWVWQQLLDGGAFRGNTTPLKKYRISADEFWSGYWGRHYNQDELAALKAKWNAYQDGTVTQGGGLKNMLGLGNSSDGNSLTTWLLVGFGAFIIGFLIFKIIRKK